MVIKDLFIAPLSAGLEDAKCALQNGDRVPVTASGYLDPLNDVVFYCGSLECEKNYPKRWSMWSEILLSTFARLRTTRCDFCFLCAPLQEVHRSLCKTKNYCSKICRKADDSVHKVCCEQEHIVEERKVKVGGLGKVEVAEAKQKGLASSWLSLAEESPELWDSDDFREMLRYNTRLVQKIQLKENRKLKEVVGAEFSEVD